MLEDQRFWGKSLSLHLFRYRQLQSEMHDFLYQKKWPAEPALDLSLWQSQMYDRIAAWYDDTPRGGSNLTETERTDIENFELSLQRAVLYLYKPSPNIPNPPETALVSLSECAAKMIPLYRKLFRGYRLTIYWQAVENLSCAGTSLLFSYVNSAAVRRNITFQSLGSLIHICSSVLCGMVEHFPAFKGKRDAFDLLASKTLLDIAASPIVMGSQPGISPMSKDLSLDNEQEHRLGGEHEYGQEQVPISEICQIPGNMIIEGLISEVDSHSTSQGPHFQGMMGGGLNGDGQSTAMMLSYVEDLDWEVLRGTNEHLAADWL